MKILFCSSFLDHATTGAGTFASVFLEWAKSRDHQVDIVSDQKYSDYNMITFVSHNKLFTKIPVIQSYQRSFIYYKTVSQQLKNKTYDLIFFNNVIEGLHTARFVQEIPVYGFLHDENFMNDYILNPSLKRKWYRNVMKRYEKLSVKMLDKVLTNSRYMKQTIEKTYNQHPLKVRYSYFRTFDLPGIDSEKIGIENKNAIQILFIKHDYQRGGLKLLAEAIRKIKSYKITLEIIGPSETNHREIKSILQGIDYEIFTSKSRKGIHDSFLKADIFCTPSHSEALGLANLEAMQYGLPVISQNLPVMKELNKSLQIMFLTEEKDLSSTIIDVIENAKLRKEISENGSQFIQDILSKKNVFDSFDDMFDIE